MDGLHRIEDQDEDRGLTSGFYPEWDGDVPTAAPITNSVTAAAARRAAACDDPRCLDGVVVDEPRWRQPDGTVYVGRLIRTCLRCSGTPRYLYVFQDRA